MDHQVGLGVEQELVDQVREVSLQQEEQEVVQVLEVEVEQVQEEHLHLGQHLRQAEVGQEDQEGQCDIRTKIDISPLINSNLVKDNLAEVAYFVQEIKK